MGISHRRRPRQLRLAMVYRHAHRPNVHPIRHRLQGRTVDAGKLKSSRLYDESFWAKFFQWLTLKRKIILLTLQRSRFYSFPTIPYIRYIFDKKSFHLINIDEIIQNSIHRKSRYGLNPGFPDDIFPVRDDRVHGYMMLVGNLLIDFPFCQ